MTHLMFKRVAWVAATLLVGAASAQESGSEDKPKDTDGERINPSLDKCVTMPPLDMTVLNDEHVYIETQGRNHYLLTTGECKDLRNSYVRGEASLVPYGRRVCQSDGSYLVYRTAGHESTCPILTIDRVTSRAEARSLAAGDQSLIQVEKAAPPD